MEKSEFLGIYKEESAAQLATLEEGLVELEKKAGNQALIQELFRAAHTLKGNSKMMGFLQISDAAHKLEDLFDKMQKGKLKLDGPVADLILQVIDAMKKGVVDAAAGKVKEILPAGVMEKIAKIIRACDQDEHLAPVPLEEKETKSKAEATPAPGQGNLDESIRVPLSRINHLLNLTGEIVVSKGKSSYKIDLFKKLVKQAGAAEKMLFDLKMQIKETLGVTDEWIQNQGAVMRGSKEMEKALPAMNQIHHLELAFNQILQNMVQLADQVQTETFQLNPVIEELQEQMKEIRMLPCSVLFEGFPRLVRDIAREQAKEIDFSVEGAETELDKAVLEVIKAPLIHLLRNAVDHGVESPEERKKSGKPEKAKIQLRAFQEGGKVVITLSDDGHGIDPEVIKRTALKKHLIDEEALANIAPEEWLHLIFLQGFSTATMITDVSGRGVGLDVVKTSIERLKGSVNVQSSKGKGSTFRLEVPLTIAILQVLLIEAGGMKWAVPVISLKETLRIPSDQIATVQNRMMVTVKEKTIPIVDLAELLGTEKKSALTEREILQILVLDNVSAFHKRIGFVVDRLVGKEEVFIKALGAHLGNLRGVSGAAILSNGESIAILDPHALAQESLSAAPSAQKAKPRTRPQKKKILLVEDSLTTRELEKAILENGGYEVETAIDGLNALEKLSKVSVDAIVSDIKMPRMDGFEFCHNVKTNDKLKDIPFVFVSSLAKEEEKRKGMEVGAQAYIVKSQFDQGNLLDIIERLVA